MEFVEWRTVFNRYSFSLVESRTIILSAFPDAGRPSPVLKLEYYYSIQDTTINPMPYECMQDKMLSNFHSQVKCVLILREEAVALHCSNYQYVLR